MTEENKPYTIPVLPDEELWEIAEGIFKDQIFTSFHLPEPKTPEQAQEWGNTVKMIWMPIGLGALTKEIVDDLGMIWSKLEDAGPRSINGYPCFFSCNFLTREQAMKVCEYTDRIRGAAQTAREQGA